MTRVLRSTWSKIGLLLLLFGSGPLFVIILLTELGLWSDPNPNPIGPGLLFFFTIWPAIICLSIGIVRSVNSRSLTETSSQMLPRSELTNQNPDLSPDQLEYIDKSSFGASLGIFYFALLGISHVYFKHLPDYFNYLNYIRHGRRHAWDGKNWESFDLFKTKNDQLDSIAKILLCISMVLLLALFIIF